MSEILQELKFKDYDKYLLCLFAGDKKQKLAALFLFHFEIYDIPQTVSESMVGKIKIQWWRDVLAEIKHGKPARPHPILQELKNSPEIFDEMNLILDSYEKIIDEYQPKNFTELTLFLEQTICATIKAASKICDIEYNHQNALAYSYIYIARKLAANKSYMEKSELVPQKLVDEAKNNLPQAKSVLKTITEYHINQLEKNSYRPTKTSSWKLALKLFFNNPSIF